MSNSAELLSQGILLRGKCGVFRNSTLYILCGTYMFVSSHNDCAVHTQFGLK